LNASSSTGTASALRLRLAWPSSSSSRDGTIPAGRTPPSAICRPSTTKGTSYPPVAQVRNSPRNRGNSTLLGISGFLDEIGFGTRLIDSKIHKVYGVPLDGLHDLFTIVIRWLSKYASTPEILALILSVVLIVYMIAKWGRKYISRIVHLIKSGPEYWFLFIAFVFAVIASVIDLDFFDHRSIEGQVFQFLEEMLELYVGLALLFSCISVYLQDSVNSRSLGKN